MLFNLQFILVPLLASIVLLTLTSYFGIHVLKREIIFIDIALAQIAVLGGAIAIYLEHKYHLHEIMIGRINLAGMLAYIFSLIFCIGAALIFTYLKNPKIKTPIEAFIGIAYAFATTAAVIILDKGAGGDVHLHDMLAGVLLWTTWPQVLRLAIIFLIIGGFHAVYRRKFVQLTDFYQDSSLLFEKQKLWDFLFYFSFGIMIIESVRIAGVLTVFAFLILPASISAFFAVQWRARVFIGLVSGLIASILGLYFSLTLDLTASPLIILFLGLLLLVGIFVRKITVKKRAVATDRR
ncbi:MAG: metal ABC transporter permease [Bacteroidota bacterium]